MADAVALKRTRRALYSRIPRQNGKPVLRRSTVQALLGCPVYSADSSTDSRLGILNHEAIAAYTLECARQHEDSLLSEVDRIARETFFTRPRGLQPQHLMDCRYLLGRFARLWPSDWQTLTRVEHTQVVDIGWAYLTGTIDREDRIDDGDPDDPPTAVRLRDYKTWWGRDEHDFQMRTYVAQRYQQPDAQDLEWVEAEVIYPRRNSEPVQTAWSREDWESGELGEWWRDELVGPLTDWWPKRRRLGPHGGLQCVYCAKRFSCAAADLTAAQVPADEDEAAEHFQVTLRLAEMYSERRAQLAKFFEGRPPMEVAGLEVGFLTPNTKPKVSVVAGRDEEIVDRMNAIGPGQGELVRRTGVNPLLLTPDWLDRLAEEGLVAFAPQDPEFKWRKAKGKAKPDLTVVQGGGQEAS